MSLGRQKQKGQTAERLSGIQVQSSVYGAPIPLVYGTARVSPNLIWYGAFKADAVVTKTKSGGKGGGGGQGAQTTYNYRAAVMMAVASGPIAGIGKIWKDKAKFDGTFGTALQQAGLSVALGASNQTPWGFLTANYPDQAISYQGLAYVYAPAYALADNAGLTNHSFEVVSTIKRVDNPDANPDAIITDVLARVPLWRSGLLASLTNYATYCTANGFWFSPVVNGSQPVGELLTIIARATNSDIRWTGAQLEFLPRGDTIVTGNGATWTPNLTPVYDLNLSVFADDDGEAITYSIQRGADAYNQVEIGYLDRARDYAQSPMIGIDPAAIDAFGLRKSDSETMEFICDGEVAGRVVQQLVGRTAIPRRYFSASLPSTYDLLDSGDYITVTHLGLGLDRQLVRVVSVNEDDDGEIGVELEEVLVGAAATAQIAPQAMQGYQPNYDALPGNATVPAIISPPRQLTEGALEMWIASSGGDQWGGAEIWASYDNTTYERRGQINGPSRYGVTTTALAIASDPMTIGSLGVSIVDGAGGLDPATQAEVDAGATLCLIGSEVIAYRDATMTSANAFTLGYLRRGLFGTNPQAHAAGTRFVRLDGAVASVPFNQGDVAKTVYIKLRSFNHFSRAFQDTAALSVYSLTVGLTGEKFVSGETISGGVVPHPRNLVPGAGPLDTQIDGAEFLGQGQIGVPSWRVTAIQGAILATSVWEANLKATGQYQTLKLIPFRAYPNTVYSAQYVAAKIGAWTSGSVQAVVQWTDSNGAVLRLDELDVVENGTQADLMPAGYNFVKKDRLAPTPFGTKWGIMSMVTDGRGVGFAHFLRGKINAGLTAAPYSDEATMPYLFGARPGGGLVNSEGLPIEEFDMLNRFAPRIEGPSSITINADDLNRTLSGQIGSGYILAFRLIVNGQSIGSGLAWGVTFSGANAGEISTTGALILTRCDSEGAATVSVIYRSQVYSFSLAIGRSKASAPTPPAATGAARDLTNTLSPVTTRQAVGFNVVSRVLKITTGTSGVAQVSVSAQFDTSATGPIATNGVNIGVQYRITGGTWVTVAEIVNGMIPPLAGVAVPTSLDWYHVEAVGGYEGRPSEYEPDEAITAESGAVKISVTTALSASTEYEFRTTASLQSAVSFAHIINWAQEIFIVERG